MIQRRLSTTLVKLNFNSNSIGSILVSNDDASNAHFVKLYLMPTTAAKAGTNTHHLFWVADVAANSTSIFEPLRALLVPSTFELHAIAETNDKLTLTLVA